MVVVVDGLYCQGLSNQTHTHSHHIRMRISIHTYKTMRVVHSVARHMRSPCPACSPSQRGKMDHYVSRWRRNDGADRSSSSSSTENRPPPPPPFCHLLIHPLSRVRKQTTRTLHAAAHVSTFLAACIRVRRRRRCVLTLFLYIYFLIK